MNIERRPVKAVKVTVYTLLVILCWLAIGFVELDSIKYFGLLRYKFISNITLIHDEANVAVEPWVFAYTYSPPYLYTYGVSGYTKTDVLPGGSVEKVYNSAYYNYVPDEFMGPFETTLQRFKDKFGEQLILRDSLQDVSEMDRHIYLGLKEAGQERRTSYFRRKCIHFPDKIDEYLEKERGLDSL